MRYRKFCFPYCQFIATTVFQSVFKKKSCALCYQLTSECNFKNYKDKSISVHEDYEKLLRKKELMIRLAVIKNIEQKKATWKDKVDWDHLQNVWIENIQFLDKLNNGRSSFGNNVELLVGDNVLFQLLKSISNSKERVWIETYMFDNSPVAQSFINALIEAKQRGVDVVLIVDRLGSFDMSFKSLRSLRQNDIPVVLANDWRSPTFRDHRKLAIVDSEGFCGSANISAEAAPTCMGGNNRFFEIHVKVQGPAVNHMCELFCETLNEQGNSVNRQAPVTKNSPCTPDSHGSFVQILDSNAKSRRRCIQSAYQRIINNACLSVSTTAGYFSPPTLLYWSLKRLIQTSIPFTLILSGNSDVWGDVYAATYCVSKLQVTLYVAYYFSNKLPYWNI
jgi:cardiolipin synthase A/B